MGERSGGGQNSRKGSKKGVVQGLIQCAPKLKHELKLYYAYISPQLKQWCTHLLCRGEQWSCVHEASVWVDRERSGGMSKNSTQGGPIPLPTAGVKGSDLSLAVWVDRSLLEGG